MLLTECLDDVCVVFLWIIMKLTKNPKIVTPIRCFDKVGRKGIVVIGWERREFIVVQRRTVQSPSAGRFLVVGFPVSPVPMP